ncbi:MAG TPA: anti-sigma F factor [Spirochaetia bacterium]|nr:anti-sigma F factor [Spirochaetia bacterium]
MTDAGRGVVASPDTKAINRMTISLLSQPVNLGLARVAVAAFFSQLDIMVSELEEIKVAVSEAVSNAILHGYLREPDRWITVTAAIYPGWLEIVVEDRGEGFCEADPPPPGSDGHEDGFGMGFALMRSFMDEVVLVSAPGQGTRVVMRKKIRGASMATPENPVAGNC